VLFLLATRNVPEFGTVLSRVQPCGRIDALVLPLVPLDGGKTMVKLFQGDCQSVQNDVNTWIEVYKPVISDFRQSMITMEHSIVILLTFIYEQKSETPKVEYKLDRLKK
jgi:hypothetical protein